MYVSAGSAGIAKSVNATVFAVIVAVPTGDPAFAEAEAVIYPEP